jgi:gamma-glutamylcyclotransferase (GGCT)/AIG2-like uncharacterized protein YtfP
VSDGSSQLVFVYGPLRRGGPEAFCMDGAVYVAKGTVPGMLYRLPEGPGLVDGDEYSLRVTGDLYRVTPDHLQKLDELDGLDSESREKSDRRRRRVTVQCFYNSGDSWVAWAWVWNGPTDPEQRIQSGDWLQEYRPGFSERLRRYPWFTLIGLICLISFPVWMLAAPVTGYYKTPLARVVGNAMALGGALSPFAAVFSLWLAKRRGERDGLFGCLFVFAIAACSIVIFGLFMWLLQTFRR